MAYSYDNLMRRSKFLDKSSMSNSNFLSEKSKDIDCDKTSNGSMLSMKQIENSIMNLNAIRDMINSKEDPYIIFEKIVSEMSENYEKCYDVIKKFNDQHLKVSRDFSGQVNTMECEINDEINKVKLKSLSHTDKFDLNHKWKEEKNVLWIVFTDPAEIENLRRESKAIQMDEAKKIFSRMNIMLDEANIVITDVTMKKIYAKTGDAYENEWIMGIIFTDSMIVHEMKRQIYEFGKTQFMNKNFDLIRYSTRNFWSPGIWKLLRICYDMKDLKLIDRAYVTDHGIAVYFKKSSNQNIKRIVKNEKDLNLLRSQVNDLCAHISAFQMYNNNYFKLNFEERKEFRENMLKASVNSTEKFINDLIDSRSNTNAMLSSFSSPTEYSKLFNLFNSSPKGIMNRI